MNLLAIDTCTEIASVTLMTSKSQELVAFCQGFKKALAIFLSFVMKSFSKQEL